MDESNSQFGMTDQDEKQAERQEFFRKIKSLFFQIEPAVIKIFSSITYYTIRFIKAFVSASWRMIMGKEV